MRLLGREGYKKIVKSVMEESRKIINGISNIPGLDIISNPDMSVFSFTSDKGDIFNIGDVMEEKGWYLNRQQFPNSLHMTISYGNVGKADEFLTELENTIKDRKHLRKEMKSSGFQVFAAKRLSNLLPPNLFEKIISKSTAKSISNGNRKSSKQAALYGLSATLDNRDNVYDMLVNILDQMYRT